MALRLNIPQIPFVRLRAEHPAADRIPQIGNSVIFWIVSAVGLMLENGADLIIHAVWAARTGETELPPSVKVLRLLYLTLFMTAVCYLYCRCFEKRSNASLGITKRHLLPQYVLGLLLGFGLMAVTVLISTLTGGLRYEGLAEQIPAGSMLLLVIGWVLQGFSEELTFRGFLMMTLGVHRKPAAAIGISALFFAFAHIFNSGLTPVAFFNLFLYGVMMSMLFLHGRSIWIPAGLHSAWNWAQGNFFGIKVSGIDGSVTVFQFAQQNGENLRNGGAFGLEGSIILTGLLMLGILITALIPEKSEETAQ